MIAFRGDLGAGKTTMSKGIAAGLGIRDIITSPTYTIISEYRGRLILYHIDAYRLSGDADFHEIGGYELIGSPGSLSLIEWSERLDDLKEFETAYSGRITMTVDSDGARQIEIEGDWLREILA